MSLTLRVELGEIERLAKRIGRFGQADRQGLTNSLAFEGENQTRRRIADEKTAPDGTPWPAWSANYAARRGGGHGLLEGNGDLLDSVVSDSGDDWAEWGSNLVYFAIHDQGGTDDMPPAPAAVPQRQMLGLSPDNETDFQHIVDDWLERQVRDA